ncbi:glycosyltransferase family 4 protein [Aquibacillus kalidii]|uniref:glycosyltransferase family 4 protein n=1 Tax=Aquibacillus kalidii TaxID=2762597 RepID=UPI0016495061|nr:glycosyltransferase family 4 protein [Aquibacillus kalidii]
MKILHLNTNDKIGGAARAADRLHRALNQHVNIDSLMFVQRKTGDSPDVIGPSSKIERGESIARPYIDKLPLLRYRHRQGNPWHVSWVPRNIKKVINDINPDVVHLHWINDGFISIKELEGINRPIVWTLHDSWPFTGGCHIPYNCDRYTRSCGSCPQLRSDNNKDISYQILKSKIKNWSNNDINVVTPSNWMAECARNSSVFRNNNITVIPNGLDVDKFKPINQNVSRDVLNLPSQKKLILFGAMSSTSDYNKGFHFLIKSLELLSRKYSDEVELIIFGSSRPLDPPDFPFTAHYMGNINDDATLALLYSAADVMCVPSLQESFGQTASESLACGTPVVAFNATGLKDIVDHKQNGYLAEAYDENELAQGLEWVLSKEDIKAQLSKNARDKVMESFNIREVSKKYLELYKSIMKTTV